MDSDEEETPPLLVDTKAGVQGTEERPRPRVPITIVTGYLGAGKTTLLNYILSEQHGKRIAVILNEFGDSTDIEKALTISKDGEQVQEWLEVGNGCICCSVKDSGVNAIESLMERSGTFDYILLETTGLADPGNLAPLFWVDEGLGSSIYLDGIVTLVDAKNILRSLEEPAKEAEHQDHHHGPLLTIAHLQISHADVLVINKSDLVSANELEAVKDRVQGINGLAKMHVTQQGIVPRLDGVLLDLHAYDEVGDLNPVGKGHSHLDAAISTINITVPALRQDHLSKLDAWLRSILWDSKLPMNESSGNPHIQQQQLQIFEIYRLKGRIPRCDGGVNIVQGVREIFEISDAPEQRKDSDTGATSADQGKLVFIGRNIAGLALQESYFSVVNDD